MICHSCYQPSMHKFQCPFCGAPEVAQLMGLEASDFLPWNAVPKIVDRFAPSAPSVSLPTFSNPFSGLGSSAADIGQGIGSGISSLASTVKWIAIAGIAVAGGAVVYGMYKTWKSDLPAQAYRDIRSQAGEARDLGKMILIRQVTK